ncbi:Protein CBR-SRW-1 [Caenorhabditis briggsae]|uniref:Protein CBR-SRW-1 n=1 Tax=Caenorhabditis briggsae TaxID=6238 RepID=A8XTL5_CAEBR|nr:Protein CBR-SRW-1 [Caenorhabditis briggsae]CAP35992.2 Protein CBR-SRW-1 [Caenorhabditis briggsae]
MNIQEKNAEDKFDLNFDYWVRLINLPFSIFGIIINIYHFWILSKKSLRDTPVFIIMMVICGSDLVQLVALLPNDAKYIVTVSVPGFCTDINPFFKSLLTLIHSFANGFTIFVSSWMAVLMAFFRSLSIKFAMSSFSEYFSKTSTAHKMATTVLSIGFFYNLLSFSYGIQQFV